MLAGRLHATPPEEFTMPTGARQHPAVGRAAFNLHRPALCQALRLQPPTRPADEPGAGRQLTTYLWEGYAPETMKFAEATSELPD